jgi:hypothetical protein
VAALYFSLSSAGELTFFSFFDRFFSSFFEKQKQTNKNQQIELNRSKEKQTEASWVV